MEAMDGTIEELCQRADLTLDKRRNLVLQIIRGVKVLHDKGLSHRDIHPCNILYKIYDDCYLVKISDFGIKTLGYYNAPKNEQNAFHIDGDEDDTNTSGIGLTSKTEANAIVREYISHIEDLQTAFNSNYNDMDMENTDIQLEIYDIVADITKRLENLVDSMQDVSF